MARLANAGGELGPLDGLASPSGASDCGVVAGT